MTRKHFAFCAKSYTHAIKMQNDIPKKLKYEKKFRLYVMVDTSFDLKMLNLGAPMMKIFIF